MQYENRSPSDTIVRRVREYSSDDQWLRSSEVRPGRTRSVWATARSSGSDVRQGSQRRRPGIGRPLPSSGPAWATSLMSLLAALWQRVRREQEIRRGRAALEALDDRALKDIGVSRHEIELIVTGRSWR